MENLTNNVLEQLLGSGPLGPVLVLSMIALIWMTKNLLSSKDKEISSRDKTIEILRGKAEEKDTKIFEFIMKLSVTMEKWTDLFDKHDQGAQRYRERMTQEVENFKRTLDSMRK